MSTLTTLDATSTVEEAIAVVERDGGVIIRDFFDSETLSAEFERTVGSVLASAPGRGSLNRVGSLLQYFPDDGSTGLHGTGGLWDGILDGMLRHGFLFMPSGKVFLSTAHTPSDIEATAEALEKVLGEL